MRAPGPDPLVDVARHAFVSLTTFRRSGEPAPTPVWVALDPTRDAALVVTTPAGTGKLKRLRNDPRVTVRPSDRSGRPLAGTEPVDGVAEVARTGPRPPRAGPRPAPQVPRRVPAVHHRRALDRLRGRGAPDRVLIRITRPAG